MDDEIRLTVRLPGKLKAWLDEVRRSEGSSLNFEIIRSIRQRMEAQDKGKQG